jgi:hypothetical protein
MPLPDLPDAQPVLDDLYNSLPQHYRLSDATAQPIGTYPLYRFLAGICAELSKVVTVVEGMNYDDTDPSSTSVLADPLVAEADWLPWLAQLVGVPLEFALSDAEKRDAILYASAGWRAGTKVAVAAAARTALTGTKHCQVYDHSIVNPGDGGEWDVLLVTRTSETPDVGAVLDAVVRRGAKPAGVVLHHRAYESEWSTIEAEAPTWADIEALGNWNTMQEVGL